VSGTAARHFLIETRGVRAEWDAFVIAAAFDRDGAHCAFALGDGTLRIGARADPQWLRAEAHDGAVLALAQDTVPGGFITGGDDGAFRRTSAAGEVSEIATLGGKWVEHVASHADAKLTLLACAAGKFVHVFDAAGSKLKTLEHPSSVTGLVFDARGKRVGASHINGASLWFVAAKADTPRRLEWKGSHIGIAISPDGDAVVTAMQENALHGWRLSDGQHMRMSGYPAKPQSMGFTRNGKWLASSGAESVVMWPFFGGGPMGKPPIELAGGDNVLCTAVACHPSMETVAAGFSDGLVVVADVGSSRILPVCDPGHGPISALAWSPEGAMLALGTEQGFAALVDFARR
jgi:WD40 repeat protein